jgi:hypothetical protein
MTLPTPTPAKLALRQAAFAAITAKYPSASRKIRRAASREAARLYRTTGGPDVRPGTGAVPE